MFSKESGIEETLKRLHTEPAKVIGFKERVKEYKSGDAAFYLEQFQQSNRVPLVEFDAALVKLKAELVKYLNFHNIVEHCRRSSETTMPYNGELHRKVRAISRDLDSAIAYYEMFVPSGQDKVLIDRINTVEFYPAFNIISESLHASTIATLCRIWDTRRDTADLNSLAAEFRDAAVIADLASAGHVIDPAQLDRWFADLDAVNKSDELLALKRARHRAIAHTATPNKLYQGTARVAQYGDERIIIERAIPLVEQAGAFIGYSYVSPYTEQRRVRREHAEKFWSSVATDS